MEDKEHDKLIANVLNNGFSTIYTKTKVLIFGCSGQDGSYMSEICLDKGHEVHGVIRRASNSNPQYKTDILKRITTHLGDLTDASSIESIISKVKPDIIFNLAAQSDVRAAYDIPLYTGDATGLGFTRILEATRKHCPEAKIYQAGSSEMFGKVQTIPQNETTTFYPRSPYGCAKVYAFYLGKVYRESYGMKVYNGILFNHESPRRGELFVTKKVVKAAVEIKQGKRKRLTLGNLESKRDWGYSLNYMEIIYEFITNQEPQDFVVATGETHSVEEFVKETFEYLGLGDYKEYVDFDSNLLRPAEVDLLIGDMAKVRELLGRDPITVRFKELIKIMIDHELSNS